VKVTSNAAAGSVMIQTKDAMETWSAQRQSSIEATSPAAPNP